MCLLGAKRNGKKRNAEADHRSDSTGSGMIRVENENIVGMDEDRLSKVRSRIGFLFQSAALFDSMTLHENLAVPLSRFAGKNRMKRLRPSFKTTLRLWVWGKTGARCRRNYQGGCANGRDWLEPYARAQHSAG